MEYASTGVWSNHQRDDITQIGMATTSHGASSSSRSESLGRAKLDFQEAMLSFQHMFPGADEEVIEQVLRANNGSVEKTIDDLLAVCSDKDIAGSPRSDDGFDNHKPPPVPSRRPYQRKPRRWNPPLIGPLPDDFLRIVKAEPVHVPIENDPEPRKSLLNVRHVKDPKRQYLTSKTQTSKASGTGTTVTEFGISEKSDRHLHNDHSKRDLDHDDEIWSSLQKGEKPESGWDNSAFSTVDAFTASSTGTPTIQPPDDPNDPHSKNKWNMGSVSKQRFNLFGKQFSLGKKKSPKALLNKSGASSSYNHLVEDNSSLVSDDDDDDDEHTTDSASHVRLDRKFSQGG